jgi:hypothetical protein
MKTNEAKKYFTEEGKIKKYLHQHEIKPVRAINSRKHTLKK